MTLEKSQVKRNEAQAKPVRAWCLANAEQLSGSEAQAGVVKGAAEVTGDLESIPQNCGPLLWAVRSYWSNFSCRTAGPFRQRLSAAGSRKTTEAAQSCPLTTGWSAGQCLEQRGEGRALRTAGERAQRRLQVPRQRHRGAALALTSRPWRQAGPLSAKRPSLCDGGEMGRFNGCPAARSRAGAFSAERLGDPAGRGASLPDPGLSGPQCGREGTQAGLGQRRNTDKGVSEPGARKSPRPEVSGSVLSGGDGRALALCSQTRRLRKQDRDMPTAGDSSGQPKTLRALGAGYRQELRSTLFPQLGVPCGAQKKAREGVSLRPHQGLRCWLHRGPGPPARTRVLPYSPASLGGV